MPNSPDIVRQYQAAIAVGGLWTREDRALIEVNGKDRATWLNNLVTNVVKTLQPGEGNYAFATNIKGRVVFDANVLVLEDRLWLGVDRRQAETARNHLDRYIITEDVQLSDLTAKVDRYTVVGPRAVDAAARFGVGHFASMSALQHVAGKIGSADARFVRHHVGGLTALDIGVLGDERSAARRAIGDLAAELRLTKLSPETINILRIEAGIPASVDDIDEDVVPPETGQIERGISYHKGCYLGQEVIERMRSHGILARKLVGLRVEGDELVPHNTEIKNDAGAVGRATSSCVSEALGAVLALGYAKTAHTKPGTLLRMATGSGERPCEVIALPART